MKKKIFFITIINENIFKNINNFLSKQNFKEFLNIWIYNSNEDCQACVKKWKEDKSFVNRKRRNNKAIIFLYDVSVLKITLFNQNKKNYL